MQIPVRVSSQGGILTPDQEQLVRNEVVKLEQYYDRLTGCDAMVAVPQRHLKGEPIAYAVRLVMAVPGGTLSVNRQPKPTLRQALRDSFDAARRQLQDHAREIRGDVKQHLPEARGTVSRLLNYEGYGFITTSEGREIYFHRNSVLAPGFDRLEEGMEVRFAEEEGDTGPQASTVARAGA